MSNERCWLEVDLDALERNARSAMALIGGAQLVPVVKDDAYGMGAEAVARALSGLGCALFGVATVPEGLALKRAVPGIDVLVMGPALGAHVGEAVAADLALALYSGDQAGAVSAAAQSQGRIARVHIKQNTGLNRIGFDDPMIAARAALLPGIRVDGLFTHLALHNERADRAQLDHLASGRDLLLAAGVNAPMVHALDSIGMVRYPGDIMDGVRAGGWLYGSRPYGYDGPASCELICKFRARIAQIRDLPAGALIGYDDDHPLPRPARIATITAGYGDGFPRLCSVGHVEVGGVRAPLAGLVSMDQLTADISAVPAAREGDEVTLLGGGIGLDEYAGWLQLNRNDALCRIARRVPRIYLRGGEEVRT